MIKFLWLKELHRLPPLPPGQTSPQRRYLTTNTNAAQRLRALLESGHAAVLNGALMMSGMKLFEISGTRWNAFAQRRKRSSS
ncbi:hypothetical protein [Sphingomonas sp. UYP23]